jgi:hypothetical protein
VIHYPSNDHTSTPLRQLHQWLMILRKNTIEINFAYSATFWVFNRIFALVFHRILDFKTRLDFYPASIFLPLHVMTILGNPYNSNYSTFHPVPKHEVKYIGMISGSQLKAFNSQLFLPASFLRSSVQISYFYGTKRIINARYIDH